MPIEVRLPTVLRSHAGGRSTVQVDGSTIREVLEELATSYPGLKGQVIAENGALHRFVNVYVNDDDVRYLDNLDTKVSPGDVVSILPAVAGGCGVGTREKSLTKCNMGNGSLSLAGEYLLHQRSHSERI